MTFASKKMKWMNWLDFGMRLQRNWAVLPHGLSQTATLECHFTLPAVGVGKKKIHMVSLIDDVGLGLYSSPEARSMYVWSQSIHLTRLPSRNCGIHLTSAARTF